MCKNSLNKISFISLALHKELKHFNIFTIETMSLFYSGNKNVSIFTSKKDEQERNTKSSFSNTNLPDFKNHFVYIDKCDH